jgi:glycerol uptake facilitator-like aquaporin
MGERLFSGNVGLTLLANTLATGAGLAALILAFGPISGAHLNPVVTAADAWQGGLPWSEVPSYLLAQAVGAIGGVGLANMMFEESVYSLSSHPREGAALLLSEFVAAFGLLVVIRGCARRQSAVPYAVAAYISAAYWFTPSTSFANPAVTLARAFTDTFVGIRPADVPGFVLAQCLGGAAATLLFRWLVPPVASAAPELLLPHAGTRSEHYGPSGVRVPP